MPNMVPTVYVVDDDPSFCRAVERLLVGLGYRVEAYSGPAEFLARWRPEDPGCVILDLRMPELPGLEVQRLVSSAGPPMPVILVSGAADVESCILAMRAGVTDILLKPFQEGELLAAIGRALAKDQDRRREQAVQEDVRSRLASLTPRELEVFRLVAKGMLNKQIAVVLGTKEGTVKMHRGHVMRKLDLGSLAELVSFADQLQLDDPCPALHARAGRFNRDTIQLPAGSGAEGAARHSTKVHYLPA
jgi:FixJ family two-component response regulator